MANQYTLSLDLTSWGAQPVSVVIGGYGYGSTGGGGTTETAASIKTKYESNANTNAFTDAEKAKLAGIEIGATADMTGAEIKAAYEAEANTNAFTDAEKAKLAGVETGATANTGALANKNFVNTGDITDGAVTYAKMQPAATGASVLAKTAAGAGAFGELAAATNTVLRRVGGDLGFGLLSRVHLNTNIVDNTILSQVATQTIKGRTTAGTGNCEDLTPTQVTAMLNAFTSTLKGLVPASGGGTTNFLRADGSWADPTGGSNPVTVGSGVPATAPASVGLLYVDDSNYNLYYSKGVATASDWVLVIDNDAGVTLASKTTPDLAHEVKIYDSENGFEAVTSTWTQIIAALKLVTLDASNRLVNPKSIYTSFDGGSPTAASTYTPAAADGNVQHLVNNAAFTLAPPATLGSFVIEIVNGATAGAITTSGFTRVSGDPLTTTNGHKFIATITVTNSVSHLNITAMQ